MDKWNGLCCDEANEDKDIMGEVYLSASSLSL